MAMFRFTPYIFQVNLTTNMFWIQKLHELNQLMMMKWTTFCNYSTWNIMKIF